jgi:Fe(3+) dicitrate transport protein
MRVIWTYLFLMVGIFVFSQKDSLQKDSLKKIKQVELESVDITAEKDNSFGISRLKNIEGTSIYAGKKTEAIYISDLNANLATNNSRQLFAKVAGISIFENDGSGISIGVGGRGLNPNRISNFNTRQNGYDISADALGYPESYYVPPAEALERIEILRGAASLQYGTQFGGMINYKFAEPSLKKISVHTRQTLGSFGLFNTFNQLSGTLGKFSYSTFYQYKRYAGWRPYSTLESHNAFAKVSYEITENIKLSGEYSHLNYLNQQPGGLTDKQFLEDASQSNRTRNWFRVNWNLYNLKADIALSHSTKFNVLLFGVYAGRDALGTLERTDRKDDTTKNRNLLQDIYNNKAVEMRLLQRYRLLQQQSHFLIGVRAYQGLTNRKQGEADKLTGPNFKFLNPDNLENSEYRFPSLNFAMFSENLFQLSEKWNVTPGLRIEYIHTEAEGYYRLLNKDLAGNILLDKKTEDNRSNTRQFILVGIGTQYKLTYWLEFYTNFSENYRSINFNDMRVTNPNFQVNPNLKDESGFTFDGGFRGVLKNILYFDVSGFWLNYTNRIGTVLKVDSSTFQIIRYRTNVSDSRSIGLETFAEIDWMKCFQKASQHKLSTFINLSLTNAIYTGSEQSGFQNKNVEYAPRYIVRTGVSYAYKKFGITCQYAHTAEQYSDASNAESTPSAIYGRIPAYGVMDVSANYALRWFNLGAGVNNTTNTLYFTRRAEGYPGPGIIPGNPLNVYITLGVKW